MSNTMNNIVFLGHLGLGDHIIQHGIVMNLLKQYDMVTLFCKHHNLTNLHHLYNNYNVNIIPVNNDEEVNCIIRLYDYLPKLRIGIYNQSWAFLNKSFDQYFYEQAKIDFEESYNYEIKDGKYPIKIPPKPFCFIHDDSSRGFVITQKIPQGINIVKPHQSHTIFDFLPLLRFANEIHCMDSSFAIMIDRAKEINAKKYLHRYIRQNSGFPSYRSNWTIIT